MSRVTDLANSVRQVRPGRVLVLAGASTERGLLARSLAEELRYLLKDLSAVMSKYTQETESNLARVLAEADNAGSVLFFDEAEALFGRRTQVKDSHDRYANSGEGALRWARGVVVLGVGRPERLPRELRERARLASVRDYWPPR